MRGYIARCLAFPLVPAGIVVACCTSIAFAQVPLRTPAPTSAAVPSQPIRAAAISAAASTGSAPTMSWQYYAFGGAYGFPGGQTSGTFAANGGVGGTFSDIAPYFNIIADSTS